MSTHAQSLPTKKEAADLLHKAAEAANLRTADSMPFRLISDFRFEIGHQSFNGKYELLWVSPDKYRETFRMANTSEVEFAFEDKLSILRNTAVLSLPLWSTRKTLNSVKNFYPGFRPKVHKVYSYQVEGESQICVDFGDDFTQRQACLDQSTNQARSFRFAVLPPQSSFPITTTEELKHIDELEYSDFSNLGVKRYPLRIIAKHSDEKLEIKIATLSEVTAIDENEFIPPANAVARDWCSAPISKGTLEFSFQPILKMNPPGAVFAYYVVVGADGRVAKWAPARSGGPRVDDEMALRFRWAKFAILSCGGKPIEYETMLEAPIEIRLPQD